MRKLVQTIFVSCVPVIAIACSGSPEESFDTAASPLGEDTYFVVALPEGNMPADLDQIVANAGGELVDTLPAISAALVRSDQPGFTDALKGATAVTAVGEQHFQLAPTAEASYALEDATPPQTGGLYPYQWDIRRVHAPEAWASTSGSHDTVVAVLDTGVAWNHPDLAPNVVFATCASVLAPCNPYPSIGDHGTHVAGTIAAAEGYGMVGVGPGLGIASYNVFEYVPGYGVVAFDWPIFVSMLDAAARGFDVVNMSLGGYVVRPASQEDVAAWTLWNRVTKTVTQQGVTIVAAAGNSDFDLNGPVSHVPSDLPSVVSVGATGIAPAAQYPQDGAYDVRAFYSNYGASVTLAAPGGDLGPDYDDHLHLILSSVVFYPDNDYGVPAPADCAENWNCPVGWAWMGGTSMAAPHVAGVAGLVRDADPTLSANQVANKLKRTAEPLGDRQAFGHGMVNAAAAVAD